MKKFFVSIISIIVIVSMILGGTYYIFFYPKTKVKAMDSNISINQLEMLKRFIPNSANISLKNIAINSDVKFSEEEVTDLAINSIKDTERIKEDVKGIFIDIEKDEIRLVIDAKYKFVPVEINLFFTCRSEDGKAILHYKEGKVGFISINKDRIFENIEENKFIKIDKEKGEIILSLDEIKGLEIADIKAEKDNITLSIHGDIKLFN